MTLLDVSRRAALYLRVSTRDQTTENQERELRSWAARLGFELVHLYGETVGGARRDCNELAALLAAAHRREFDVLLIWSLDRLSREGIGPMAGYMGQFRAAGIRVMSHQEPWLDTGGPCRSGPSQGQGRQVRAESSAGRCRGALPSAGSGPGLAADRPSDEDPYLDPPTQVSRVPKVPCGLEACPSAIGAAFRGPGAQ